MISAMIKFIVPFILILSGLFETVMYFLLRRRFQYFPVVATEIIESRLFDDPFTNPWRRVYEARIKFKYSFRGKDYISETPVLRGYTLWNDYDAAWELLRKYKKGDIVNAHVVPNSPDLAYLEIATLHKPSAILMPFVAFGYIGVVWGYFYIVGNHLF